MVVVLKSCKRRRRRKEGGREGEGGERERGRRGLH